MNRTKIEWAEVTWNPVTGCTPVSPGCEHCYARRIATRLQGRFGYPEDEPFRVMLHPERLEEPFRWRKPRRVFVCSMSDLFHEDVPDEFICRVFVAIALTPVKHTFLILTKRPQRMHEFILGLPQRDHTFRLWVAAGGEWPLSNVWLGVTAENQQRADERIPILLQTTAAVRFVSVEPMLGPVNLSWIDLGEHVTQGYGPRRIIWDALRGWESQYEPGKERYKDLAKAKCMVSLGARIDWVICGGETGPGARPMHPDWVRNLRDQCDAAGVAFFFKHWGEWMPHDGCWDEPHQKIIMAPDGEIREPYHGWGLEQRERGWEFMVRLGKKHAGRLLDGRAWDEMPSQVMAP